MSKEKMEQIIDEAYENYLENCLDVKWMKENFFYDGSSNHHFYLREQFINKCKTDSDFSEKWGLKIEERELTTVRERKKYDNYFDDLFGEYLEHHETLDKRGVPRKIITLTYNNETIITYEQ